MIKFNYPLAHHCRFNLVAYQDSILDLRLLKHRSALSVFVSNSSSLWDFLIKWMQIDCYSLNKKRQSRGDWFFFSGIQNWGVIRTHVLNFCKRLCKKTKLISFTVGSNSYQKFTGAFDWLFFYWIKKNSFSWYLMNLCIKQKRKWNDFTNELFSIIRNIHSKSVSTVVVMLFICVKARFWL